MTAPLRRRLYTVNHFRAIDYRIDMAEEPLSEEIIKHLHYLLKSRTKNEALSWLIPATMVGTRSVPRFSISILMFSAFDEH